MMIFKITGIAKLIVLIFAISAAHSQERTRADVLSSNPEIAKYDSLVQKLRETYINRVLELSKSEGRNYQEAFEENNIPDSLFRQLAKSQLLCRLYHTTVDKNGDFDIYGGVGAGWMLPRQIYKRLPEPWNSLITSNGYLLVEVLEEIYPHGRSDRVARCRVIDDILGTVEADTIYVKHWGSWELLLEIGGPPQQILIQISTGSKMFDQDMNRVDIYYALGKIPLTSDYALVDGDSLNDKDNMLYKHYSSYSTFRQDIINFIKSVLN